MTDKTAYVIHIAETRHFEFTVWADDKDAALDMGREIWREAPTTGQWEIPDTETDYHTYKAMPVRQGALTAGNGQKT
jgi:hypothetical protein